MAANSLMDDGRKLFDWLEIYYIHQWRKLALVRTMLVDDSLVDRSQLTVELALTMKLHQLVPQLPDDHMMKVVPSLEIVKTENFESGLPWNRHKRRRLKRAKHIILHILWFR